MTRLRLLLVPVLFSLGFACAPAPAAELAPTYLRHRPGAEDWLARGGGAYGYGWAHPGVPFGFVAPPVIAGSWYARPYPYHFDYYRYRWGGAAAAPQNDCPCAADATASPTESAH